MLRNPAEVPRPGGSHSQHSGEQERRCDGPDPRKWLGPFSEICPEHAASSSSKWFSTVKPSSCVLSFPLLNPFGEAKRKAKDQLKAPQLSSCLTRGARRGSARDVQRALPPRQECLSRRPRHGVSTASPPRHATHVPPGSLQGYFGLLPWRDSSPGWLRHLIPGGRPRIVNSLRSPQSQGVKVSRRVEQTPSTLGVLVRQASGT